MILKDYNHRPDADPRSEDNCAEVASRLRNAFRTNEDVLVLNDVPIAIEHRTVNVDQVVLHSYGITLINSRTLYGKIEVNYRHEWSRALKGRDLPMENPIELFKYVSRHLRNKLVKHTAQVLSKANGIQKTFDVLPIDVVFVQAPKSNIQGSGVSQSNMIFVEQLTQMITRSFSSYKKREFQTFGGIDVFKFLPSDMYATADLLLGNEIDRAKYPTLNNPAVLKKNTQVGKPVIVRVHSRRPIRIIKAKDIRPSRKKVDADTSSG